MFVHWDILKCSPTERFNLIQEILSGEEKENVILSVLGFLPLIFYKQVTTIKQITYEDP